MCIIFSNENDHNIPGHSVWFQQYGVLLHFGREVREYLNEVFPGRWVGRRG